MEEELLPLGSAVKTKYSETPLLIAGYYPVDSERKTIAKYVAVDSVLGFGTNGKAIMLEESDITKIISKGFTNERGDTYRRNVSLMYENAGLKELIKQKFSEDVE